ncbi:MAG: RagB/SusD family nutrient uptake outer membrane protein [Paludibacter sp.]|jgi:hypothetical protein|nr:RagB/SusD family nutrient uptake outer membrane protein [Paludibacter sp.]
MKKYIQISFFATVLCSVLLFSSCTDFLTEDNKAGETADLTYSTESGIRGLVSSCYAFARGIYGKEAGLGLCETGTDLFYFGQDNKQVPLNDYTLTSASLEMATTGNPSLDHYWELFYCAVDAANNAIKFVPQNKAISETTKNAYLGEAYFLRAFYNFHLVNVWGDVPYNDAPISSVSTEAYRVPEATIYDNILADLAQAETYFQSGNLVSKSVAKGRAYYWAARALKARVLLYKASWLRDTPSYALAAAEADAVIGSGEFSFYNNYFDGWDMKNEDITTNKEGIFAVTYSDKIGAADKENVIPKRYKTDASGAPLNYNEIITRKGYNGQGGSVMHMMFVSLWSNGCTDIKGDVFVRVVDAATETVKHTQTGVAVRVAEKYSPYSRGFTRYLPSLYLWETLESIRATDQRPEVTLLTAYTIAPGLEGSSTTYPLMKDTAIYYSPLDGNSSEGQAKQAWAKDRYRIQFAYNGDIPVYTSGNPAVAVPTSVGKPISDVYGNNRYADAKISGRSSFPAIQKFADNVYVSGFGTWETSKRDAIVLRLAEMYLIKAEAQINGAPGDALATINTLRDVRAIPGKVVENRRNGSVTIDTILEERAIELCGEQQRWFDLKRTHKLEQYVKERNAQASPNFDASIHYLRPIPQAQMDAVSNKSNAPAEGKFWQNPGY